MSNNYVTSAFQLRMTKGDADMVRLTLRASELLDTIADEDDLKLSFDGLGYHFITLFPAQGPNDFGTFLDMFDDPEFPTFDCDITIGEPDEDDWCDVGFSGSQFGVEQVANLIFTACKSALPCAFSWAFTCDKLRVDEFGGGCVIITEAGIDYHSTTGIIGRALAAAETPAEAPKAEFDPALVTIERKRFSVTQGETLLSYNGHRIEQYGDKINLIDGEWKGSPDEFWMAVAYREVINRNLAARLSIDREAKLAPHPLLQR